jgi:hypothetical protein
MMINFFLETVTLNLEMGFRQVLRFRAKNCLNLTYFAHLRPTDSKPVVFCPPLKTVLICVSMNSISTKSPKRIFLSCHHALRHLKLLHVTQSNIYPFPMHSLASPIFPALSLQPFFQPSGTYLYLSLLHSLYCSSQAGTSTPFSSQACTPLIVL